MNKDKQKRILKVSEKMEIGVSICDLFRRGTNTIDECCQIKKTDLKDVLSD